MSEFKERLVLKQQSPDRIVISQVGWEFDWDFLDGGSVHDDPYVDVWFSEEHSVEVHYVEDGLVGLSYVTLYGDDVSPTREQVKATCEVWTQADALAALQSAKDRDDRLRAIYAAALSAVGPPDDALIDTLGRLARTDMDPGIRQAIVVATGYLPWPQLVALVEELRDSDPEDHVRHNAGVLLDGLRLHPPGPAAAQ